MEQFINKPPHTIRVYDDPAEDLEDDLLPEYDFGSLKPRSNPYAARALHRQAEAKEAKNIQSNEA